MTMEPQHRFCKSPDGTEIGYTKIGTGSPLIGIFPCFSDFDTVWKSAEGPEFVQALARSSTFIAIDRRSCGLSQREVEDVSLEAQVTDLEAVLAYEGIDKFDALGGIDGCAVLLSYAADHPDRVGRLVLWSPYARYDFRSPERISTVRAMLVGDGWSMVRRAIADVTYPSGTAEERRTYSQLMKAAMSPQMYAKFLDFETSYDIMDVLPRVDVPVLVVHRKDTRAIPVSAVRTVASLLPNAELLLINGDSSAPWTNHSQTMGAIDRFLGADPELPVPSPGRAATLATVLFTDLVGHTEMMSRLGDERGRDVLREHERITREVLKANGGTEVKTMGDGFMASFGSVTRAVECAVALQRAVEEWNRGVGALTPDPSPTAVGEGQSVGVLKVRCGLNAGEPIEEDGDLFGATVILASRIAAKADGGEILVADTVRGLCSGKGFLFSDRGEFVAKGFEEPVRVYEVRWRDG